ncbi:hypothetical protein C8R47DRAFT_1205124 [Mycena vitilis]|nr:hypothetical protein C8R47DRAFT_1205124 [Mycena vitilis]
MTGKRKKKASVYHLAAPQASALVASASGSTAPTPTPSQFKRVLREKTHINLQDGHVRQTRAMVEVDAGQEQPAAKVYPDIRRERAPLFDLYSGGDEDVVDDVEEARDSRESDKGEDEGEDEEEVRGSAKYRCNDCLGGDELLCHSCLLLGHRQLPFHRIEHWTGAQFERKSLKDLGLRIQLGHWHGATRSCSVPTPAINDDFVVVDVHGVHQLLRARLWAATTTNRKTAATFGVLRKYHLMSFESKCSALEFYQSLARETDNLRYKKDRDRYNAFLRMTRQWRHVRMLKRAGRGHVPDGIATTTEGSCALLCPPCPHPGKNMAPNWMDTPEEKRFIHALFLAIDANFRLKRKDVSSEEKDPGLSNGWAFFCEVKKYMAHVKRNWNNKQPRSHCVAHDAVDKPDREARGTASSRIGAVDCARHNMKRPNAMADLQLGERYLNMDYMFFRSIKGSALMRFFVSYDITCQWHLDIWNRMIKYKDDTITIDGAGKFMTFLVPKFHLPAHIEACNLKYSFNLTRDVGQTDGEAPERGWANANPLARSTKEMGPGSRRDTLDDHFNDWNHKKIIALGYMLRRKTENTVPEMVKTKQALDDMQDSLGPTVVEEWTVMAETWEADETRPNPFETLRKDLHIAKVRAELAAEAAAREAAGTEEAGAVRCDMHITELIAMGLQLEDQQRVLASDVASTGLHPTDRQRTAMIERTSKLRRKIFAWIDVQTSFFPGLKNIRELEDAARARLAEAQAVPGIDVSDIKLWLPSAVAAAHRSEMEGVVVKNDVLRHEYRLRVGQAEEALHEVRRLLLVRTHLYQLKDTHSRGVRANMRSQDKITALNSQIQRAAAQYRAARVALVTLGRLLKEHEWQRTLQELKEDDVRGLPQSQFHDPTRKKMKRKSKRRKKVHRPPSWIWMRVGALPDPSDTAAMNEAVRIEWAKVRARCLRWGEEVDLLEEEMARVVRFLLWRAGWWNKQIDQKGSVGPQLEGETVYAAHQAALLTKLAEDFSRDWASPILAV